MRLLPAVLMLSCGAATPQDAGVTPLADCTPEPVGPQRCIQLGSFPRCMPTEAATLEAMCDLALINPYVSRWTCVDGTQWRVDTSPQATCSFVDGGLVGASIAFNPNASVGGSWQLHGCTQRLDMCAESVSRSCSPRPTGLRHCTEERSSFPFCEATESAQRARLCSDAGSQSYGRHSATCDGGVRLMEVISGTGPTRTCNYVDGGFAGASGLDDTSNGLVMGVWSLADCEPTPLCP